MKLYKRRGKRLEMSIGQPFANQMPSSIYIPKNTAKEALRAKQYLVDHPDANQTHVADQFGVTRARISQLLKISTNIPDDFIAKLAQCKDPILLRRFTGKRLLKIASLEVEKNRIETIELLMPKDKEI